MSNGEYDPYVYMYKVQEKFYSSKMLIDLFQAKFGSNDKAYYRQIVAFAFFRMNINFTYDQKRVQMNNFCVLDPSVATVFGENNEIVFHKRPTV